MLHSLPPLHTKARKTIPLLAGIQWSSLSGKSFGVVQDCDLGEDVGDVWTTCPIFHSFIYSRQGNTLDPGAIILPFLRPGPDSQT